VCTPQLSPIKFYVIRFKGNMIIRVVSAVFNWLPCLLQGCKLVFFITSVTRKKGKVKLSLCLAN
jgi:hypothetical protein